MSTLSMIGLEKIAQYIDDTIHWSLSSSPTISPESSHPAFSSAKHLHLIARQRPTSWRLLESPVKSNDDCHESRKNTNYGVPESQLPRAVLLFDFQENAYPFNLLEGF